MNEKRQKQAIPFNPRMLRWAREWRQRSVEETAKQLEEPASQIAEWEDGGAVPTVVQARKLADFYGRPFVEFFWDEPPELAPLSEVPDFRLHRDAPDKREQREIVQVQAWAEEQRLNALDLYETLGEEAPAIPIQLTATLASDPEAAAIAARDALTFPIEEQMALQSGERGRLPSLLRSRIEEAGVLTFKRNDLAAFGARGLCIALFPLPIIVFTAEAPTAQAFTLSHELGHVALKQSAISGAPGSARGKSRAETIEKWCDQFAAAFLVPASYLNSLWSKPNESADKMDDVQLGVLSRHFNVSPHSMLIRLVHLGYVKASYYWEVKRPQFLASEAAFKSGGRSTYYGSRYRSRNGDLYTSLVLEAWGVGALTAHNAAEYMGIRNVEHLVDISKKFAT